MIEQKENMDNFTVKGDKEEVVVMLKKINNVLGKVKKLSKKGRNDDDGYDYLQASDCINEVRPLLAEEGLHLFSTIGDTKIKKFKSNNGNIIAETLVDVNFRLYCVENGAYIAFTYKGYALDGSDKFLYKAYTNAKKYALKNNFMLASGAFEDVEQGSYKQGKGKEVEISKEKKEMEEKIKQKKKEVAQKVKQQRKQKKQNNSNQEERHKKFKAIQRLFAKDREALYQAASSFININDSEEGGLSGLKELDEEKLEQIIEKTEEIILEEKTA